MALQKNLDLSHTEIDALARDRFGDPTQKLCRPHDLRFGTHGSVSVNRDTGAWYDHENRKGGWLQSPRGSTRQTTSTGRIVAEYDYLDADGSLLFQVCRLEPKTFRQRRPDGGGGWIWTIRGVTQVPYRLPEIAAAPQDATIFIVEGEKDADALARLGVVATCNAGGAGKWKANFGRYLTRRSVVILPDNDEAGEAHALDVAAKLSTYASAIRILRISNVPKKGMCGTGWRPVAQSKIFAQWPRPRRYGSPGITARPIPAPILSRPPMRRKASTCAGGNGFPLHPVAYLAWLMPPNGR